MTETSPEQVEPETTFAPDPAGAPGWLLDGAFAAMVLLIAAGFYLEALPTGFALAFAVHVFTSLYHGRFGRIRKLTWLLFWGGWTLSFLIGFLGYVLPWGQMSFWLAAHAPPALWQLLPQDGGLSKILIPLFGAVVLIGAIGDVIALHGPRLRTSRATQVVVGLLVIVIVLAAVRDVVHVMSAIDGRPPSPPRPVALQTIPPIGALPLYALLRAGPTKMIGAALPPLLAFLVAIWPWRGAWRYHAAPTRLPFTLLWLGAGVAWLGLGGLGALAPTPSVILGLQALVLYELAFLLVAPSVLARFLRPAQGPMPDRRAEVF